MCCLFANRGADNQTGGWNHQHQQSGLPNDTRCGRIEMHGPPQSRNLSISMALVAQVSMPFRIAAQMIGTKHR